jgi:hypothetical protein
MGEQKAYLHTYGVFNGYFIEFHEMAFKRHEGRYWEFKTIKIAVMDRPGANPTNAIYNAGAVKIYNAMSSLAHFKTFFSIFKNAVA